jgi:Ca2+-binding RTX toxin-like protein
MGGGTGSATGGEGNDILYQIEGVEGSDFNDTLMGGDGSDHIQGGAGSDSINGGLGDDFITGGQGSDTIDGGADYDMISYRNFDYQNPPGISGVNVNLSTTTGTATDNWGNTDTLTNIENIEDSPYNDMLIGNSADNFFSLSGGVDTVDGGGGHDTVSYENATSGIVMGALVSITPNSAQPVNVSSNTSPSDQTSNKAIDGKADTKYLNFGIHNTGLTITFSSPSIINSIRLTTAGDMPGRDPASFEIFGINNDGSSVNITTQPIPIALGVSGTNQGIRELTSGFYNFNNTNAYSTYKIVFPKVISDFNQNYYGVGNILNQYNNDSMQIADIYFYHLPNISNIEDTNGSNYNDSLIGNNDPNLINGKNGNDTLNGGAGVDTLVGGVGSDTFVFNLGDLGFPDLSNQTLSNLNITDVISDFLSGTDKINFGISSGGIEFFNADANAVDDFTNIPDLLLSALNFEKTDGKILFYFGVIDRDGYLVTEDDAGVINNIVKLSGVTTIASTDIVGI